MKLSEVKSKYMSAGDIIYRTALRFMLAKGTDEVMKQSRPKNLDTIDSYVLACAADIAEAEDFMETITRPKNETIWVIMYEDEGTDGPVLESVYATREGAVAEIKRRKEEIVHAYGLDDNKIEIDVDEAFRIYSIDWQFSRFAYVTATKVAVR